MNLIVNCNTSQMWSIFINKKVDKNGNAIKRYYSTFDPREIEKDLLQLL